MAEQIKFRIYYINGKTYSGPPELAPVDGVLVIVERSKFHGRRLVTNGDVYCWDPIREQWLPGDDMWFDQYMREPGWKRVLFGRTVSDDEWNEVVTKATSDPDFPIKTAYDFLERVPPR